MHLNIRYEQCCIWVLLIDEADQRIVERSFGFQGRPGEFEKFASSVSPIVAPILSGPT